MRRLLRLAVLVVPILSLAVPAAHAVVFTATLDGPSEFPSSPSLGTDLAVISGDTYFNIHTTFRPGGEIRGFLTQVPAAGALALLASDLAGVGAALRTRRR